MSEEPQKSDALRGGDSDEARQFAISVARIAAENKTEEVAVLDLRGLSGMTDFFVIGTGTSDRQMGAVLDHVEDYAATVERHPFNIRSRRTSTWILADYFDVVLHLFDAAHREYYDLDGLWGDAPQIDWQAGE